MTSIGPFTFTIGPGLSRIISTIPDIIGSIESILWTDSMAGHLQVSVPQGKGIFFPPESEMDLPLFSIVTEPVHLQVAGLLLHHQEAGRSLHRQVVGQSAHAQEAEQSARHPEARQPAHIRVVEQPTRHPEVEQVLSMEAREDKGNIGYTLL
jgi:hypothetical protein